MEREGGRETGREVVKEGRGPREGRKRSKRKEKICAGWRASVVLQEDLTSHRRPAVSSK